MIYGALVESTIDSELEYLKTCKYGIPINGELKGNFTEEEYNSYYHLLSPKEFKKYNGGVCYDYVNYLNSILSGCTNYYIEFPKIGNNHTICVAKTKNKPYAIYEFSDKKHCGIHQFSSLKPLFQEVLSWMAGRRKNPVEYRIIKYPSFISYSGCDAEKFRSLIEYKGNVVDEGTFKK